jgi:hypothetical protein
MIDPKVLEYENKITWLIKPRLEVNSRCSIDTFTDGPFPPQDSIYFVSSGVTSHNDEFESGIRVQMVRPIRGNHHGN